MINARDIYAMLCDRIPRAEMESHHLDSCTVKRAWQPWEAVEGDISWLSPKRNLLRPFEGSVLIASQEENHQPDTLEVLNANQRPWCVIRVPNPRLAWAYITQDEDFFAELVAGQMTYGPGAVPWGINVARFGDTHEQGETINHLGAVYLDDTAVVLDGCRFVAGVIGNTVIEEGARIGIGCHVGAGCRIGKGAQLHLRASLCAGVSVGEGAKIGAGAMLHQGCTIGEGARIGGGAIVCKGVTVGAEAGVQIGAVVDHDILAGEYVSRSCD